MKDDPVVAMVTRSGKRVGIPKLMIGRIEECAAHYGCSRTETYRSAIRELAQY